MKNILVLALALSAAALEAPAVLAQTAQPSKKEMKRQDKARKKIGPEVYKGSVAEQQRLITDAPGAEKDKDGEADAAGPKKIKRKN